MKKAPDTSLELQELRKISANKRCFDCNQAGTTYAAPEIGIFLCSICGGIHREFNHRVKGLSTCNFTEAEVNKLKLMGNEKAATIWMARHDARAFPVPDLKDANKLKEFLRVKYVDKRFYENRDAMPASIPGNPPSSAVKIEAKVEKPPSAGFINLLEDEPMPTNQGPIKLQDPSGRPKTPPPSNNLSTNPPNFFPTSFPPPSNSNPGSFVNQLFQNPGAPSNAPNPAFNQYPQPNIPSNPSFPQINPIPQPLNFTQQPLNPQSNVPNPSPHNLSNQAFSPFMSGPSGYNNTVNPQPAPQQYPPPPQNFPHQNYPQSFQPVFPQNYPPQQNPNPMSGYPQNYPPNYPQNYSYPNYTNSTNSSPPVIAQPQQTFFPKSMDPFEQIMVEERERKIAQQNKANIPQGQNILMQQYQVQGQIYQKTYGVPYPYTFQQWAALNNQSVPHERPHSKNPFDLFT